MRLREILKVTQEFKKKLSSRSSIEWRLICEGSILALAQLLSISLNGANHSLILSCSECKRKTVSSERSMSKSAGIKMKLSNAEFARLTKMTVEMIEQ